MAAYFKKFIQPKKDKMSLYHTLGKILQDELAQANFTNDWKKRQEINLQILWLNTIREVETTELSDLLLLGLRTPEIAVLSREKKKGPDCLSLSKLTEEELRFPVKWKLDDLYHFPFVQGIVSEYGRVLAENDYKGLYKPDSILTYPKHIIKKAIYYIFDYLNLNKPLYEMKNKDKYASSLNTVMTFLYMSFIDTGDNDLPKNNPENFRISRIYYEKQAKVNEIDELDLIDWRTEGQWILKGIRYIDSRQYDIGEKCLKKALEINPNSQDAKRIRGTFVTEEQYHQALKEIKKSN